MHRAYHACTSQSFAEVVLATLLKSFKFSLTKKEIVWNWATLPYPTMDEDTTEPSMVLKLDLVQLSK